MLGDRTFLDLLIVIALCGGSALLAHIGAAVFHDGIRPVLPEFIEKRMTRPELASIAFGLSVGFIASVGIAHTLATNILNPWLLFLTTDILGIMAPKKWIALVLGGLWGALTLTSLGLINTVLTGLPVDMIAGIASLGDPVIAGFSLFPLVAIFSQFGTKSGLISTFTVLVARQIATIAMPGMVDAIQMLIGILILLFLAVYKDKKLKSETAVGVNVFTERIGRIKKNLPYLMIMGALIAIASNAGVFAGSEVSIYTLAEAQKAATPELAASLTNQAALAEFIRGLGFIPLIATTAITTGVYGVAGLTFVYPVGYLMPNLLVAGLAGAGVIFAEVMILGLIGTGLSKFPSIRDASDNIRSAMTTVMEFALLIGSINATVAMGGYTGFFIGTMVYFINEMTGRKVMRMAIGPVAAIITGILLNILYLLGLFVM